MIVLLDTGIIGRVTHPHAEKDNDDCNQWLKGLVDKGYTIIIPEIADYEIRRKYLHRNNQKSIQKLDRLNSFLEYLPLNTAIMRKAAGYWAECRNNHRPFSKDEALDGDVILCAQANSVSNQKSDVVVATTNVGHLSIFVEAKEWQDIA